MNVTIEVDRKTRQRIRRIDGQELPAEAPPLGEIFPEETSKRLFNGLRWSGALDRMCDELERQVNLAC